MNYSSITIYFHQLYTTTTSNYYFITKIPLCQSRSLNRTINPSRAHHSSPIMKKKKKSCVEIQTNSKKLNKKVTQSSHVPHKAIIKTN